MRHLRDLTARQKLPLIILVRSTVALLTGSIVVIGQDLVDAPLQRTVISILLALFGCLTLAYALACRLRRLISEPLLELVRTARQVACEKNYTIRAAGGGQDELGLLINSFNDMMEQIQERDLEYKSHCEQLEEEVARLTTELRATNAQLAEAKKNAEATNSAKSQFLVNRSHEIRTPLNAILAMTELVLATDLTSKQREHLLRAKSSGQALLGFINGKLNFSNVDSGKPELEEIAFDLPHWIAETLRTLASKAQGKGLELTCRIGDAVPQHVLSDPSRLRQILLNLVGQAIEFTDEGELLVEVNAPILPDDKPELRFTVSASGAVIPSNKQQLPFGADSNDTRRLDGTAPDPAICQHLVRLMGGRISVENQPGQGIRFRFTIPLREVGAVLESPLPASGRDKC